MSPPPDPKTLDLKVGFEIHQQLGTRSKLFCKCICDEADKYAGTFMRKLRPTQSELGAYDPAALFESKKMRTLKYHISSGSSCLVEADEEPPHDISSDALATALIFSLALKSKIVDEAHVMRKIVIDGSNTSGFQRTMLVASGGNLDVAGKVVGVQSICLEEDAAKLISDNGATREYGLDRLGVPLVEIALDPVTGKPDEIRDVALTLGRLLRASKRVARGLGSIRQDVNVSIMNGAVVEVKGVQRLDQLVKVIEYETLRQHGLVMIAEKLKEKKISENGIGDKISDISDLFSKSSSKTVKGIFEQKDSAFIAIRLRGLAGMIGYEPYPDVRIGKELGQLVRFYGFRGVFHSDELPNYGITTEEVEAVRKRLELTNDDAFVIIGGSKDRLEFASDAITRRLKAALLGVPAETRAAKSDGKTEFIRPRPGAARMYPETDILPIPIGNNLLESLADKVPKSWEEVVNAIASKYCLNNKIAEQIFDSDYLGLFEDLANSTSVNPTFVASKLTEDILSLERQGLDSSLLKDEIIKDIFVRLDKGAIAKESVILIFEKIMKKEAAAVDEAIGLLGLTSISDEELGKLIDEVLKENMSEIKEKGTGAAGKLMGRIMARARGKADGQKINSILKEKLEKLVKQ